MKRKKINPLRPAFCILSKKRYSVMPLIVFMSQPQRFELASEFQPAGDQPKAIAEITERILSGFTTPNVARRDWNGKTFTMANVVANVQNQHSSLLITKPLRLNFVLSFKSFSE